jgi:urea transport system permease protein
VIDHRARAVLVLMLMLALAAGPLDARAQVDAPFATAVAKLKEKSFREKQTAVEMLAAVGGNEAKVVLESLLAGEVYKRKSDKRIVILSQKEQTLSIVDAISGEDLGETEKNALKRVVINNTIRGALKQSLARMSLQAANAATRRAAVESLFNSLTPETVGVLRERLIDETESSVQQTIRTALSLADLESEDASKRAEAAQLLAGSMALEVRNRLAVLVDDEEVQSVRAAAAVSLAAIDQKRSIYSVVETLFFGISLGSVFVLAAIGLAITFGVMGVINMAHGELIMLGAYTTWVVQQAMPNLIEQSLFVAIPAAFLVSGLAGVAIERFVVRYLYGRPLETLLATFGVSLVLQQTVRSIFSPLNRAVSTPDWMSGQYVVNGALAFTYNRLFIIVFSLVVFLLLTAILNRTTLGLQIRAVSQDRDMARAMGIQSGRIDSMTFGLGAGVAGLAGVALSQLTNVGPNLGQSHIVDSFMVVVFGGVGNLWGTLVAGLTLGISNKLLEPFVGAVLAKIFVLVFIVLFIQARPRGLFPPQGRSAEA